jgi:hypothetical protein
MSYVLYQSFLFSVVGFFKVSYAKDNLGDIFESFVWIKQFRRLIRRSPFAGESMPK